MVLGPKALGPVLFWLIGVGTTISTLTVLLDWVATRGKLLEVHLLTQSLEILFSFSSKSLPSVSWIT